jgi:hypothetical protein
MTARELFPLYNNGLRWGEDFRWQRMSDKIVVMRDEVYEIVTDPCVGPAEPFSSLK